MELLKADKSMGQRVFLLGAAPSLTNSASFPMSNRNVVDSPAEKLEKAGGNSGNQVIGYGLLKTIMYESVSWDYSIGPDRVNQEFDIILVAAANFLHSEFDLGGMASFIEATKLPCVMVGVGAQSKNYSTDIPLKPGTERLMRVVAERSRLIGARGQFTEAVLEKMGIRNVQVTGCPSYYMNCQPVLHVLKPPLTPGARLLINSSRDVVSHAFDRDKMIEIVCSLVSVAVDRKADFVAQSELEEILIASTRDGSEIARNVRRLLEKFPFFKDVSSLEDIIFWLSRHCRVFWDVSSWYNEMRYYDFVFGNRFHGNMIALQAGTPACVVCHDTRTSEMCEFLGLPFVKLQDIEKIDVDFLYSLVDPSAIQSRYTQLYPLYKDFLFANGLLTALE